MLSLPASDYRSKQLHPRPFGERHQRIDHLVHALPFDLPPAGGTVNDAAPCIQEPEIIVNLRDRSDCRARVVVRGLLVDRDRGGKPLDALHLRLFHLSQELPGIAGQRLHIAPLPFRVDRVKGKRTLAGTGQSRHHDKFIARDIQVDILQIMLRCPADPDILFYVPLRGCFFLCHIFLLCACFPPGRKMPVPFRRFR